MGAQAPKCTASLPMWNMPVVSRVSARRRFIMEHFTDIATKSNELLMLSDEAMVEIISSDDLNVKNEEIVFESIIRWINHEPTMRRIHIAKLLRCIRLGLLSTQYFVETVKVITC